MRYKNLGQLQVKANLGYLVFFKRKSFSRSRLKNGHLMTWENRMGCPACKWVIPGIRTSIFSRHLMHVIGCVSPPEFIFKQVSFTCKRKVVAIKSLRGGPNAYARLTYPVSQTYRWMREYLHLRSEWGIEELFPLQREALTIRDWLGTMSCLLFPQAVSGKSLVGQLTMIQRLISW